MSFQVVLSSELLLADDALEDSEEKELKALIKSAHLV
jgi:hypothetical protein